MMAERRNGGKPRREENNKTSGSVNERKRQTHSRKYDVTGGEKQIKTGSKGKNVQGKPRQASITVSFFLRSAYLMALP